jgi:hypothetical protein
VLLALGHVLFSKNRIGWAFRNADCTIDAFIGVDGQKVGAFTKAVHGTDIHAVGVFAADTGFGDNVSHGLGFNERVEKVKNEILVEK